MYFIVKFYVNILIIILVMLCMFLSVCIEGDKEVIKMLILLE